MSYRGLLNQRCTIKRWTVSAPDGFGEFTPSYATVQENVRCAVQTQGKPIELEGQGGRRLVFLADGFFEAKADLRPGPGDDAHPDLIEVDGATWAVLLVADVTGRGHHKEATLRQFT